MPIIKFDKDAIEINCIIRLGFTNRAYRDLCKCAPNPEQIIVALSKSTRLIVVARDDEETFSIITPLGNFLCGLNQKTKDGFSVITYRENDLRSQNRALKQGIVFSVCNGINVDVLLPDSDMHYKYLSGEKFDYNAMDCGDTTESAKLILHTIFTAKNEEHTTADEAQPDPEEINEVDYENLALKEILKQAEQYSILSSELDEKKTHEMGQMSYRAFFASDYDRTDRIAYAFIVDEIDKSVFKVGVQVELQGRQAESIKGEIVEIDGTDENRKKVVILFNLQISIEMFEPFGLISLSFSTVNKDVQLAANEKIRSGTAKGMYLKSVLGGNRTAGFDKKDLSAVIQKLNEQEYPPNDSQINAIQKGINSKDVFLVMGPPGTGKTTVILEWVKYFVGVEHKKVLVSSQNNKAVDNVLARLAEEKDIDVIRIGSESKLQQEVIPYMFENKLVTLNRSIDEATNHSMLRLNRAVQQWEAYKSSMLPLTKQLREIDQLMEWLEEKIADQLVPVRSRMKTLYAEYREMANRSILANQRYRECKRSIAEYETKNFVLKFILEKKHNNEIMELASLEKERMDGKKAANECALKYNTYSQRYRERKEKIAEEFRVGMKKAKKKTIKEGDAYIDSIPDCPHIAGLFENIKISRRVLQSPVEFKRLLTEIDAELDRAKAILEIENCWRKDIVGKQNYALNEVVLESVDLVGATCIGVSSQRRFANLNFDVTIIDEAGQIQIHNALVPMSVSNKLIMLGDYKQIPPSADQELIDLCNINGVETDLLKMSLFEKLFTDLPEANKMMLDTQYRMPGEIADIISEWFYAGAYKSPKFKRNLTGLVPDLSPKPFLLIDTSHNEKRYETRTPERGTYNELEADVCHAILKHCMENGCVGSCKEIGIISAYKDQVAKIKKAISKTITAEEANSLVATLDSFQGQERNLIIYSFTKSSKKKASMSRIGFLNELRRLNVAMSRCRKTLIMVGDFTFLSECMYQDTDEEGCEIYEHSEKEFSDFIRKMIGDVKNGRGEFITYDQFKERVNCG